MMKNFILMSGLVLSSFLLHAQKNYAVMVADSKTGNPIIGATVKIKSTGKTVATSESGNVVIFASPDDSLQVKFNGYKDREIAMEGQAVAISIVMEPKPKVVSTKATKKRH